MGTDTPPLTASRPATALMLLLKRLRQPMKYSQDQLGAFTVEMRDALIIELLEVEVDQHYSETRATNNPGEQEADGGRAAVTAITPKAPADPGPVQPTDKPSDAVLDALEDFVQEGCSARPEDKHHALQAIDLIRGTIAKSATQDSKDAARYRWIRTRKHTDIAACWLFEPNDEVPEKAEELDAAIDRKLASTDRGDDRG